MPTWKRKRGQRRADGDRRRRERRASPRRARCSTSGPMRVSVTVAKSVWSENQIARFSTTPTTAAVIPASAPRSGRAPAQALDPRRSEEDPEEARHVGHPRRQHRGERAGEPGRERARAPVGAEEADELHHLDQRTGRRLRHAEAVEHLAGREPAVVLDGLLRHVGEHGVGAAEGHDGELAEEEGDLREDVVRGRAPRRSRRSGATRGRGR